MTTIRTWKTMLISAALTAGLLVAVSVAFLGDSAGTTGPRTTGETTPLPDPTAQTGTASNTGPEGVPVVTATALGPASSPAKGQSRAGVPCGSKEQLSYHVHARLTVFVNGKPRGVPLGIGIGKPVQVTGSGRDRFASGGSCFSFLHTHASDGVIHIEAPGPVGFRLRQFFAVWDQRLDRSHLGRYHGRVTAYVNGKRYGGDPRGILLKRHAQIQLELGRPRPKPVSVRFPAGL